MNPSLLTISPAEARGIAKEAYLYGFPLVTNYRTMYRQAVDTTDRDYRAPFNVVGRSKEVTTPEDGCVVTPNSDKRYSYLWMDLRAEPQVITMPKIETGRYYSGQLIDLYTFNAAYLGTRSYGNEGGSFVIAGPGWNRKTPKGATAVLRAETEFAYMRFRTQLFSPADLPNVDRIQAGIRAQALSEFLGVAAPPEAPGVHWPKPLMGILTAPLLFRYLNFLLQFCPTHPSERDLMASFARLNIGAGKEFDEAGLSPENLKAGIEDAGRDFAGIQKRINDNTISSGDMFGTREFLKNNYLYRYVGARLGLYGNSVEEAIYFGYAVDAEGQVLNAGTNRYTLTFAKGQFPPAKAFWSLTMYDGKTLFLVANPLQRYLLNSTMLESFDYGADGSLTFYVQKDSPGTMHQANWLPAPDGPFYAVLRLYLPSAEVVNGTWKQPAMQVVKSGDV